MSGQTRPGRVDDEGRRIARAVRDACARVATEACELAGMSGLCEEGRIEMALDAIRTLDVDAVLQHVSEHES